MTLPDPNNFISAYSYLPLAGGVAFTCRMPKCRYYSVSLYAGLYDPVQDKVPPSLYVRAYVGFVLHCSVDRHTERNRALAVSSHPPTHPTTHLYAGPTTRSPTTLTTRSMW